MILLAILVGVGYGSDFWLSVEKSDEKIKLISGEENPIALTEVSLVLKTIFFNKLGKFSIYF